MRILFITDYLPPQISGISTRCANYISRIKQLGHSILVIGPEKSNADIKTIGIPIIAINSDYYSGFLPVNIYGRILYYSPDIVHIFCPANVSTIPFMRFLYLNRIPVVCSHHCEPSMLDNLLGRYSDIIKICVVLYHNYIYTTSAVSRNLVPVILPIYTSYLGNHLSEIPSGYDEFTFNTNGIDYTECCRSKRLVYVGRLSPEKSVNRLLLFFKQLYAIDSEYTLDIVGDGPSRTSLESYVATNQVHGVSFRGNQPHHIACNYYKNAQAFVTFSTTEAFGFTCLEALACGTHCIYPKCDVFDKLYLSTFPNTGFDSNDFDTFKRAVDFTYNNDKHIENNEFTLNRTWKKATEELVAIYSDVIRNN